MEGTGLVRKTADGLEGGGPTYRQAVLDGSLSGWPSGTYRILSVCRFAGVLLWMIMNFVTFLSQAST